MKKAALLRRFVPSIAAKIKKADDSRLAFCLTDEGEENLRIRGQKAYFHSPRGAVKEAEKWLRGLFMIEGARSLFVYGIGLGWYYFAVRKWLRKDKRRLLIFLEDDFAVIKKFLSSKHAEIILDDRQVILLPFDKCDFQFFLAFLLFAEEPYLISALKFYEKNKKDLFAAVVSAINTWKGRFWGGISWYEENYEKKYFKSLYRNLFNLDKVRKGSGLFSAFENIPVIICGAGPSLKKNIPLLKKLRKRALIFASGNAISVLGKNGLVPHFLADVDPVRFTKIFRNPVYELPLYFIGKICHKVLEIFHGDKLLVKADTAYPFEDDIYRRLRLDFDAEISFEMSSTAFCLALALALGSKKIIFVGVDLAYKKLKKYSKEVTSSPIDDDFIETDVKKYEKLIMVRGTDGGPLCTTKEWQLEAWHYSKVAAKKSDVSFYNVSHEGLEIGNFVRRDLTDIAAKELVAQFDLLNMVHGMVQQTSFVKLSAERVCKVLRYWQKKFERAEDLLDRLDEEYLKALSSESCRVSYLAQRLKRLKVYKEYLIKEDSYFSYMHKNEIFELLFCSDRMGKREKEQKKIALERKRIAFFRKRLSMHISLMEKRLSKKYVKEKPSFSCPRALLEEPDCEGWAGEKKVTYYSNGAIKAVFYRDKSGFLHGPSFFYAKGGEKLASCHFVHGKREGQNRQYYLSGAIYSLLHYKNGQREGKQSYFYENGRLKSEMTFRRGLLHGCVRLYYPNGGLKREINFKNGLQDGGERFFSKEGVLLLEAAYKRDRPYGIAKRFYPSGRIKKLVRYFDEGKNFDFAFWREDGSLIMEKRHFPEDVAVDFREALITTRERLERLKKRLREYE